MRKYNKTRWSGEGSGARENMGVETALSFLIPTLFFAHHFFITMTDPTICLVVTQLPDA